jgi:putative ABC transport system permease protein
VPAGYDTTTFDDSFTNIVEANTAATSIMSWVLLGFAGLSLFVGVFMIFNTFSILVAQRSRELGSLRAIGASRKQVRRLVAVESTVVGVIGSAVGMVVGWCICALIAVLLKQQTGFELYLVSDIVVTPTTIITCLLIGVGVTRIASLVPARRASRVSPIAALGAIDDRASTTVPVRRVLLGFSMLAAGVSLLMMSQLNAVEDSNRALAATLAVGALLVFMGMVLMAPMLVGPMTRVYSLVLRRWLGMPGQLGLEQARGMPRRVAATSVTFMIGLGVVATVAMPLAAMEQQVSGEIGDALRADVRITNGAMSITGTATIREPVVRQIEQVEGVGGVAEVRSSVVAVKKDVVDVRIIDPATYARAVKLPTHRGNSVGELGDDEVMISRSESSSRKLKIGDPLKVSYEGASSTLRVAGIHNGAGMLMASIIMSDDTWAAIGGGVLDPSELYVTAGNGTTPAQLKRRIVAAADREFPTASILTEQDMRDDAASGVQLVFNIILGLCGAALIVALFGIANTMALSLYERTRELGMLRAVGMTRRQVRKMIRWEAIAIGSFGSLMGIAVGVVLGTAIVLLSDLSDTVSVPWEQMGVLFAVGVVAGLVASALPAWRTSRIDVLDAINTQ